MTHMPNQLAFYERLRRMSPYEQQMAMCRIPTIHDQIASMEKLKSPPMSIRHMAEICDNLEASFLKQFGPDEPEEPEEPHFPINQDDEE